MYAVTYAAVSIIHRVVILDEGGSEVPLQSSRQHVRHILTYECNSRAVDVWVV
jgi:hypothetical protein